MKSFCALLLVVALLVGCAAPVQEHTHEYSAQMVALSCTQDASITYTCSCGETYTEIRSKAPGHHYVSEVVAATTANEGYTEHVCSACGDTYRDSFTDRLEEEKPADLPETPKDPPETPKDPPETPKDPPETPKDPPETPKDPPVNEPLPPAPDSGTPMPFFSDAAFIGDSISLQLQRYHASTGIFCGATFLTMGSYSVDHAVNGTMKLTYQGQQMSPEDALAASGVSKVFILLGMNDVGWFGVQKTMAKWPVLIQRIREKCPNITIYIQSGTPIFIGGEKGLLNNNTMNWYNSELSGFAAANGCQYIDIASAMKNKAGGLREDFCSDSYVHLTNEACVSWVSTLRAYVGG